MEQELTLLRRLQGLLELDEGVQSRIETVSLDEFMRMSWQAQSLHSSAHKLSTSSGDRPVSTATLVFRVSQEWECTRRWCVSG